MKKSIGDCWPAVASCGRGGTGCDRPFRVRRATSIFRFRPPRGRASGSAGSTGVLAISGSVR